MSDLLLHRGRLRPWALPALGAAVLAACLAALAIGRYTLTIPEVVSALGSPITGAAVPDVIDSVVYGLRMPRVVLAVLVGAGLASAGAAFQSLFSNPLATPDTLGVTGGASVGAVVALVIGLPMLGVQFVALLFGIAAVALTSVIANIRGRSSIVMLLLSGVVVAAIANAALAILKFTADPNNKLPQITYWLLGSLTGASVSGLVAGGPLIVIGVIVITALRWRLNVLSLSDDEARASGMKVRRARWIVIIAATLVTASCVSMCGQVGWVGLLIPHCARMICGNNNRNIIPVSTLLGAIFVIVIDTLARTVSASEIPISVLTAVVGAPFFIVLLRRTGGRWA